MSAPTHEVTDVPYDELDGFSHHMVDVGGFRLHAVTGGAVADDAADDAPAVVLLAGAPQSWWAWHAVMPELARDHRVVAVDLPGQGHSDRPADGYDTRSAAGAVRTAVRALGVREHLLLAHDIGAWVAVPYALADGADSGELRGLLLLDAGIPGVSLPSSVPLDPATAHKLSHFAFHLVPDLPETLISGHEREYVAWFLTRKSAAPDTFSDAEIDRYARLFAAADGVRAILSYYRAVDRSAAQNAELAAQRHITVPVVAVSSDEGSVPDMAAAVRPVADDVVDVRIADAGHFVPEEAPARVLDAFAALVARSG